MTVIVDLSVLFCLWGWAATWAQLAQYLGWGEAKALERLVALGFWALLGWALCLLGFTPHPTTVPLELLPMHPQLGPLLWLGGPLGLRALAAAWSRLPTTSQVNAGSAVGQFRRLGGLGRHFGRRLLPWVVPAVACYAWTLGPPLRPDESLYHLSLPLQYLRHGHFVTVEGHGNGGFLALGDMLFFWCLAAGAPGAARAVQLFVALMGVAALQQAWPSLGARRLWFAAALCVGAPVVLWDLCCAYVDCIEAVFSVVGVVCLARWRLLGPAGPRQHLWMAAWLLGCGAACRHLALSQLPALALLVLWAYRADPMPQRQLSRLGRALRPILVALLPPAAFVGHNLWVYGNPVYPFAASFFPHGQTLAASQMAVVDRFLAQHGPVTQQGCRMGLDALLHLPYALFFEAAFASPRFDGVVGFLPLVALSLAVWRLVRRRMSNGNDNDNDSPPNAGHDVGLRRLLGAFAALRFIVWLSASWQARFLIAAWAAVSLWLALAWPPLPRRAMGQVGACGALLVIVALWIAGMQSLRRHWPPWDRRYLGSPMARHATRLQQWPASGLCERLAAGHGAGGARVMLVWTQRLAAFCPAALWSDSYNEAATLQRWLQPTQGGGLQAQLQAHAITHLLVDEAALAWQPGDATDPTDEPDKILQAAWQQARQDGLQTVAVVGTTRLYVVRGLGL